MHQMIEHASYMAHGYCLLWKPWLVVLHAGSDLLIFAAYAAIPLAIWLLIAKRPDLAVSRTVTRVAWLFVAFILLCGITHLVNLVTLWWPIYETQGVVKLATALVSVVTAVVLIPLIPRAAALPTPDELEATIRRLENEAASHRRTLADLAEARDELQKHLAARDRELDRATAILAAINETTPTLIYAKDEAGRFSFGNPALFAAIGKSPEDVIGKTELDLLPDRVQALAIMERDRQVRAQAGAITAEEPVTLADGRRVIYLSTKIAQRDAGGNAIGLICVSVDITERKCLEVDLALVAEGDRARTEELEALLDVMPAAVFIASDPAAENMTGNAFCHKLLRVEPGGSIARSAPPGIRPENFEVFRDGKPVPREELPVYRAVTTGKPVRDIELELVFVDGERRFLYGSAAPLFNADGSVRGGVGAYVDFTGRKQAEQRLAHVLREMKHRLLNLAGVVQGMARLTLKAGLGSVEERLEVFDRRMVSLGESSRLLADSQAEGVPLQDLVRRQLSPFVPVGDRLRVAGPPVLLADTAAQLLGMALHELATNAVKYGAWSSQGGSVDLSWQVATSQNGRSLDLQWQESGGPEVRPPTRTGFGRVVVHDMIAEQLKASVEMDFGSAGLTWRARLPLDVAAV